MKTILKAAALSVAIIAAPVYAQVAVADLDVATEQTTAIQNAQTQIKAMYKTQIDAVNARQQALIAQMQPLQKEIEALQKNPATPRATLEAKVNAFRTQQANAQRELQTLATPFVRPSAYANSQVNEKMSDAVKAAMTAKGIKVVIQPDAALAFTPDANLTGDITAQLNTLVKTVSITPPAGWQPGQAAASSAPSPSQGR